MSMWVCPNCKGSNLDYGSIQLECEACYFPRTCEDCGMRWEEWYSMEYDWQYNLLDKDGNEILSDKEKWNDSEGTNK